MTNRILSQHGNVIAADFRPRPALLDLAITFSTETLYCDGHITLIRCSFTGADGKHIGATHVLGDLATGRIAQL